MSCWMGDGLPEHANQGEDPTLVKPDERQKRSRAGSFLFSGVGAVPGLLRTALSPADASGFTNAKNGAHDAGSW